MKKSFVILCAVLLLSSYALAAPVISPQKALVGVTFARVIWNSTEASTSRVDYGSTTSYGSNETSESSVTWHVIELTGLTQNTTYHYQITSGSAVSDDYTFTTYADPTGTVRTVGSGKTHSTIQACVNAMSAGDTCVVYAGAYNETVNAGSGTSGNYKTVLAQELATVTGFAVGGDSYFAIKGFEIDDDIDAASDSDHITIENNYLNVAPGSSINPADQSTSNKNDNWKIYNNVMREPNYAAIMLSGEGNLIDDNMMYKPVVDCIYDGALTYSVIRNNICHDAVSTSDPDHIDFLQWDGGTGAYILAYTLIENNSFIRCTDTINGADCHFLITRGDENTPQNLIIRHNYIGPIDGSGMTFGTSENNFAQRIYNNTFLTENKGEDGVFSSYYANYTKSLNNIAYDTCGTSENCFDTGTGIVNNYNVQRDSANGSATWGADYQSESTYSTLKNLDPEFSNYPYDDTIPSDSAVVDVGGPLTTVSSGCNSSTLTFADVRWFQPGWAGTDGDTVKIGATVAGATEALITGVNYNANANIPGGTVTFGSSVSCTNNDSVWLYKDSDGTVVLAGTAPDVGSYESGVTVEEEVVPANAIQGVTIN